MTVVDLARQLLAVSTLDLRPDADGDTDVVEVHSNGSVMAAVRLGGDPSGLVLARVASFIVTREVARALLTDLVACARAAGDCTSVALETVDPVLRDEARAAGWQGGLREQLFVPSLTRSTTRTHAPARGRGSAELLAAQVGALVPDLALTAARPARGLRRLARTATSGITETHELIVGDRVRAPGIPPLRDLRVTVPADAEILVEVVARVIDTITSVRRLFRPWLDHLKAVAFDRSSKGFIDGVHAGYANRVISTIHLNGDFVLADRLVAFRQWQSGALDEPVRPTPPSAEPRRLRAPADSNDATAAHECWHLIELGFESKAYGRSIEFRRRLGEYFGAPTLEHVLHRPAGWSSGDWDAANRRLRAEVSDYAGTNAHEATAEMFKHWWCGARSPIVDCFIAAAIDALGVTVTAQ